MKATFPFMGNIYIPVRTLFSELGAEPIIPPPPNKKTVELGVRLAPEQMCSPFKIILGNMVTALEMGADTLVHITGFWSCRFGYYGKLHNYILKDLGYKFNHLVISSEQIKDLYNQIKNLHRNNHLRTIKSILTAFYKAGNKSYVMEYMEKLARETRPYEIEQGRVTKILNRYLNSLDKTCSVKKMKRLKNDFQNEIKSIKKDMTRQPLKIKLVGESYCMVEPYVNFNLIQVLGEKGIFIEPFLTAHKWLGFHLVRLNLKEHKLIQKLARPYLKYNLGGEDETSIGHSLLAVQQGYDGIISIHPFGCMPSAMIQPILHNISRDKNIPLLDIGIDEHTSETGFYTRIEAFISVLEKRRKLTKT